MKILSSKKYRDLIDKIHYQIVTILRLKEANEELRILYAEKLNEVVGLKQELERSRNQIAKLQSQFDEYKKKFVSLSKENRHLEAEIERAKNVVQS